MNVKITIEKYVSEDYPSLKWKVTDKNSRRSVEQYNRNYDEAWMRVNGIALGIYLQTGEIVESPERYPNTKGLE